MFIILTKITFFIALNNTFVIPGTPSEKVIYSDGIPNFNKKDCLLYFEQYWIFQIPGGPSEKLSMVMVPILLV